MGASCSAPTVNEIDLQKAVVKAINNVLGQENDFQAILERNIATVLNENTSKETDNLDVKLENLQNELVSLANSGAEYEAVVDEIRRLRELKQEALTKDVEREHRIRRIEEMIGFV